MRYITASLYSSFIYWHDTDFSVYTEPDEAKDAARKEYLNALARVQSEPNEAMLCVREFEQLIRDILDGKEVAIKGFFNLLNAGDVDRAREFAGVLTTECMWQVPCETECAGVVLYGIADAVNRGVVYDIKRTSSYDAGKYYNSIQHLVYMRGLDLPEFKYLISTNGDVFSEDYQRNDELLESRIRGFLSHLDYDTEAKTLWLNNWEYKNRGLL